MIEIDRHQALRERVAKLAAAARALNASAARNWPRPLVFLTDRSRIADPISLAEALPPDAMVILRDYDAPDRLALARALRAATARSGAGFLIGADAALADEVMADGVHLPEQLIEDAAKLRAAQPARLLSGACHSAEALRRAAKAGVDVALVSPVFPTASHPGAPSLGVSGFRDLCQATSLPVIALGGVDEQTAPQLADTGGVGFAAIGAFAAQGAQTKS